MFKGIGAIALLVAGSVLIITEFTYASFATAGTVAVAELSIGFAIAGVIMVAFALVSVYKATYTVGKKIGSAMLNNVGITATVIALILILFYCLGILS
ncbi:MAG: hypothetical protein J6V68_05510 [Clostridia bacterium]|nr:hypothetical protein [Clostridia bacterium]